MAPKPISSMTIGASTRSDSPVQPPRSPTMSPAHAKAPTGSGRLRAGASSRGAFRRGARARDQKLARSFQSFGLPRIEAQPLVQDVADLVAELRFIHGFSGRLPSS